MAFKAHTHTPTFAFSPHLKVILSLRVCAVGGLPDSRATPLTRMAEERGRRAVVVVVVVGRGEGR